MLRKCSKELTIEFRGIEAELFVAGAETGAAGEPARKPGGNCDRAGWRPANGALAEGEAVAGKAGNPAAAA